MVINNAESEHIITTLCMNVVPVFFEDGNGYPSDSDRGSGFIVRSQDRYFLVSAEHVLRKTLQGQKLFIPMSGFFLDPSRLVFAPGDVDLAIYDLGMRFPLPQSLKKAALPVGLLNQHALPQDQRLWGPTDQKWLYLISGFPASEDQIPRVAGELTTSTCYLYGGVDQGAQIYSILPHLDPDIHLVFTHYDGTECSALPPPDGMSGSPVWLGYEDGEDISNPNPLSIIGVFIEYWPEYHAAVAVHINEVVKLISQLSK
jgi:hypothetical protein